jgi:hypothetical protein
METDGTTKILLLLIAVALWGLLLKPAVIPTAAVAQAGITKVDIDRIAGYEVSTGNGKIFINNRELRISP